MPSALPHALSASIWTPEQCQEFQMSLENGYDLPDEEFERWCAFFKHIPPRLRNETASVGSNSPTTSVSKHETQCTNVIQFRLDRMEQEEEEVPLLSSKRLRSEQVQEMKLSDLT
jgi:hypothetical protein